VLTKCKNWIFPEVFQMRESPQHCILERVFGIMPIPCNVIDRSAKPDLSSVDGQLDKAISVSPQLSMNQALLLMASWAESAYPLTSS